MGRWVRAPSLILALLIQTAHFGALAEEPSVFHIGFSSATFGDVNENDALAAVRIWSQAFAHERGIVTDPQPKVLRNFGETISALTNKTVDCLNLTLVEYAALQGVVPMQECVVSVKSNSVTEEYLLLVNRESGIERLSDLQGRKLGLLHSSRASLAPAWLETILAREGLSAPAGLCSQVTSASKISKVVLPVFFHQLDACVVTRNGFDTMIELNPQVGRQLKVLATSPPVVPVVFCFRADYISPVRTKVLAEITRWHTTPAGRQILTMFQTDSLEERPLSCLDSALEMLAEHRRLCGGTNLSQTELPALQFSETGSGKKANQ